MLRRIYLLVPEPDSARGVVTDLEQAGIPRSRIHAMARPGVDISGLPAATAQQKQDRVWFLERLFWNADLILFALGGAGLLAALYFGQYLWILFSLVIMVLAFVAGERFATRLPHGHLKQLEGALDHGEVLLMVDLPRERIAEIEHLVQRHHPDAEIGTVGWTINALGA